MSAFGNVIEWPLQCLSLPPAPMYLGCAPSLNSLAIGKCSLITDNATMSVFLHSFFPFQLFPWDNFPGTTLLNPKLWMISMALDNRLSKCPAKRENMKLEESQVPTRVKQPNKIWQSHAQNTKKLLKEHRQGLLQYVKMCPLASQGS